MGVVINEFEVLGDPRGADRKDAGAGKTPEQAPQKLDPRELDAAQRQLQQRALRLWAH